MYTGHYCRQSRRKCLYAAYKEIGFGPRQEWRKMDKIGAWVKQNPGTCLFSAAPLLRPEPHRDDVLDHCHIPGENRGETHSTYNLKLRIEPKTQPLPVVFHNLWGYDAHHLMQLRSAVDASLRCIANNMEKYVTFSAGAYIL